MSVTNKDPFPLCAAAGLTVYPCDRTFEDEYSIVKAIDVERWLAEAKVIHGRIDGDFGWYDLGREFLPHSLLPTHIARLLLVQPKPKDTAESLLRELTQTGLNDLLAGQRINSFIERARALLERVESLKWEK